MEPDAVVPTSLAPLASVSTGTCPVCHQTVLSEYYFCPNCGASLHPAPLQTTSQAQALIYAHSIILPMLLFITITKWKGYTYYRSEDPKAKQIGTVAIVLMVLSLLVTCWLAYVWTMDTIQSSISSINADMSI